MSLTGPYYTTTTKYQVWNVLGTVQREQAKNKQTNKSPLPVSPWNGSECKLSQLLPEITTSSQLAYAKWLGSSQEPERTDRHIPLCPYQCTWIVKPNIQLLWKKFIHISSTLIVIAATWRTNFQITYLWELMELNIHKSSGIIQRGCSLWEHKLSQWLFIPSGSAQSK